MKFLKKLIIGLLLGTSSVGLYGAEKVTNCYNYVGIGAGLPTLLSLKVGHREQKDHHGFEYGVGMTPLIVVTEFHGFVSYLYYPKSNLDSQTYLGVGLKTGGFMKKHHGKFGYVAPGFLIGKEFATHAGSRRFMQVAVGVGAQTKKGFKNFSSISFTYGFAF